MAMTPGSVTVTTSEPAWSSSEAVNDGDRRSYADKVYEAENNGTTGNKPPQHTTGTVEDDNGVQWAFIEDDTGDVTKSGAAGAVFDKLLGDTESQHGITAKVSAKRGIADLANAIAVAVQHVKDNAKARITTGDSGLQRDPASGDPTNAPSSDKLIDVE